MSTWDDKPNDYEHAVRLLEAKDAEIARLRAALEEIKRIDWSTQNDGTTRIYGRCSNIARKALAKEEK